jgi:hypothetical protein
MEGTVLHFDESSNKGIVRGEDGDRFEFTNTDWNSSGSPRTGAKVDFVAKDNIASEIYAVSSPSIAGNVAGKISDFQGSGLGEKISALFGNGLHNKLGFLAALAVLVSLFFPVIEIPLLGKGSLISTGTGKFLLVLLIVLAVFFYGGATRLYTRILAGVVLGILFFQYYDLFSALNQASGFIGGSQNSPNLFNLIQWGTFINVAACAALFYATYVKSYTNNEKAI